MINDICGSAVNIKLIADGFYEAYKGCIEDKNFKKEGNCYKSDVVNIPAIVNAAFACELYLKSMQKNNKITHELIVLYSKLEEVDRLFIKDAVKSKLSDGDKSFEEILEGLSGAFEYWHYI